MFSNTWSPAFSGQGTKHRGDPCFIPARGEGVVAVSQTGAAGAAKGLMMMTGAWWNSLWRKITGGKEAGIFSDAGCAAGAGWVHILEHTGLVTVISHHAPVTAVTWKAEVTAFGGAQRTQWVHWKVEAALIQITWKDNNVVSLLVKSCSWREVWNRKLVSSLSLHFSGELLHVIYDKFTLQFRS